MIKNHIPGTVRYFTYWLIFPRDRDHWVESVPFVHALDFVLPQTTFGKDPNKCRDIMSKGETSWKDHNGVTHRVVVEESPRAKRWGVDRKGLLKK